MPRVGVTYEVIKLTAIKLLSQGQSPSVQKVREMLGTGSNTTIAEHLKAWREEYASKEIHHLPVNMPKELISAIEILWQTAMDQASQQLASIKNNLAEEKEILRLDRTAIKKVEDELRARLTALEKNIDDKNIHIQKLQTELAITQEKSKQQIDEIKSIKLKHESQLQRIYNEKSIEIENNEKLRDELNQLKQHIDEQDKKHHSILNKERALQEESERRWLKLIDQARTETINQQKRFENTINKQNMKIETLQTMLSETQQKEIMKQHIVDQKNERITELSNQHNQIQEKYQKLMTTNGVLQERLNHKKNKRLKLQSKK